MLKKFTTWSTWWFICVGLSILVSDVLGWTERGKAFLYINLGGIVAMILVAVLIFIVDDIVVMGRFAAKENVLVVLAMLWTVGLMGAAIQLATWVVTKLFGVDFYVAYQFLTFCFCFYTSEEEEEEEKKED